MPTASGSTDPASAISPGPSPIREGVWQPIDLPAVLQLAGEKSIGVELARKALEEAAGNQDLAVSQFLGRVFVGGSFIQHSGNIQDVVGQIFPTDKSRLQIFGRPSLTLNPARAWFETLAARQLKEGARKGIERVENDMRLAAVEAYYDLGRSAEQYRVAFAAQQQAEELVRVTRKGEAGGVRTPADTSRSLALAAKRELDVHDASARFQQASVRLSTVLRLPPDITLVPSDPESVRRRIELVAPTTPVRELVESALVEHPEIAERNRQVRAADDTRKAAVWEPLIPRVQLDFIGGGLGKNFNSLGGSEDFVVSLGWELEGLGLGNFARDRIARARLGQAQIVLEGTRDKVAAGVVEAYIDLHLRLKRIETARRQFQAAEAGYREIAKRAAEGLSLQLDVLTALEEVAQAETALVESSVDYNKAQYRLHHRLGRRP